MKNGWQTKRLCEAAVLQRGFDLPSKDRVGGAFPLVSSSGISDFVDRFAVRAPGVATGRSGSIGNVFLIEQDFWPLNTVLYVKEFHGNEPKFIYYLLKHFDLRQFAGGAGVPTLNRNSVHDELVSIPPLTEQQRIVGILDEAFEGIDHAIENVENSLARVRELFENCVFASFRGGSKGWSTTTLACLCDGVEYGTATKSLASGRVPVIRMGNIQGGAIDWSNIVFTDNTAEIEKYRLSAGDVLFNRTNSAEHVGKAAIYRGERQAIFAGYLIRIHRKKDLLDGEFLNYFLNSTMARKHGKSVMSQSVNQANISGAKLKEYPISIPSLKQQLEIVEKLHLLQAHTTKLDANYQYKLDSLRELKQALLRKAFAGELTAPSAEAANEAAE